MPVCLHIGFEKTGSKSIQTWLRDHPRVLEEHGMRFPRGWLKLNYHQELPLTLLRLDRMCSPRELGNEWLNDDWRADVIEQVRLDLACHPDELTILSSENLDLMRYDDELYALRGLIGDAMVLGYTRHPASWLPSLAHQYTHGGGGATELSADPDAYNYLEPDSWRCDYRSLLSAWGRHFPTLVIDDYQSIVERDGSVLPSFLDRLGLPLVDTDDYWLNARHDDMPRVDGNRYTNGLYFGQEPADAHEGGNPLRISMSSKDAG